MTAIQGQELARACARAADDMKAENIRIWDLRGLSNLTDYMIICTAGSKPQMRGIIRDISKKIGEDHGSQPLHTDGQVDARWVVLDYVDVMIHVMDEEMRDLYSLEQLWKDAKPVDWEPNA